MLWQESAWRRLQVPCFSSAAVHCIPCGENEVLKNSTAHSPGATPLPNGAWQFSVWAPQIERVQLHLKSTADRLLLMSKDACGFHNLQLLDIPPATTYLFRLDDQEEWPDPASRWQPQGVHGPSQICNPRSFSWTAQSWKPLDLTSAIIYELHVGTFSPDGTFDAIIPYLDALAELGITTIEIMPVAQFPGSRNWGYDGTYLYAPQNTYGGPQGLQRLVDAAHKRGLTMILDVVYNHVGPEGNYLGKFAPYYTDRYKTPWGSALNFDDADSGPVRDFFISNAIYWLEQFRFDGLRLDAIDGIRDFGAHHFLAELSESVQALSQRLGMKKVLIAESDMNDRKVLDPRDRGGFAMDAQWSDDFHHSLHTLLTGESAGYYSSFGQLQHLADTLRQGWYYDGRYSKFRRRKFGNSPRGISPDHFVVCIQNHDQVGNRAEGDRLGKLVDLESQKLAAGVVLLSPFVPMLFMGEEYGEIAPFLYFTSHEDAALIAAVRKGRREEFAHFGWHPEVPDPQSEKTFHAATLRHDRQDRQPHSAIREFYKQLIALRKKYRLGEPSPIEVLTRKPENAIVLFRRTAVHPLLMIFHFGQERANIALEGPSGDWSLIFDSSQHAAETSGHRDADLTHGTLAAQNHTLALDLPPRSFLVLQNSSPTTE
jgi:maltooligosyltrehalose trehalohydrolase